MKLKEALKNNKFVVTSEVQSPVDDAPESLIENMKLVRGRVNGISVSDATIEGVVGDNIKTCDLLNKNRFEPIYQTTTRNKNRIDLEKDLVRASDAGVDNLLVFTEDYRITGDSLQEMMFFHVDSGKLSSVLSHMREGQSVDGGELKRPAEFTLGSGVESAWGKDVPDLEMKELEEMTNMGTGYFLSTPVFDLDKFQKFMARVDTFGVPVIAEVLILRTAGMAKFFNSHFRSGLIPDSIIEKLEKSPDRERASIEVFAETVAGLKEICQGVHIITIGGEKRLRHYLDAAKLI
jgi:5,10-methylenetetrahydrofolate reductase